MPRQVETAIGRLNDLKRRRGLRDYALMGAYAYYAEPVATADLEIGILADTDGTLGERLRIVAGQPGGR